MKNVRINCPVHGENYPAIVLDSGAIWCEKCYKGRQSWFCKKHGLAGKVDRDWCFGCYQLDEDSEKPVPYIGYKKAKNDK